MVIPATHRPVIDVVCVPKLFVAKLCTTATSSIQRMNDRDRETWKVSESNTRKAKETRREKVIEQTRGEQMQGDWRLHLAHELVGAGECEGLVKP